MAKVALQGSRTLGTTKWPWSCCQLFLCQSTRKSQQTWCRQTDAAETGEGPVPSSTTPWVRVSHIFLADAAGPTLQGLPHLAPFLISFQTSESPSLLLLTPLQQAISSEHKCAFTARSLEWAQGWTRQITLQDVAMFNTQSWRCLAASPSISMVVRTCYENQLNSEGGDSSFGPGRGFLHDFRWICQCRCAPIP